MPRKQSAANRAAEATALLKAAEAIRGLLDYVHETSAPEQTLRPTTEPGAPLQAEEFPSTWQLAQLTAQLAQPTSESLLAASETERFELVPNDPYNRANHLAFEAMRIWRASHDVRLHWLQNPNLQMNYAAVMAQIRLDPNRQREAQEGKIIEILERLSPSEGREHLVEQWAFRERVAWREAAQLLYPKLASAEADSKLTCHFENIPSHKQLGPKKLLGILKGYRKSGILNHIWHELLIQFDEADRQANSEHMRSLAKKRHSKRKA